MHLNEPLLKENLLIKNLAAVALALFSSCVMSQAAERPVYAVGDAWQWVDHDSTTKQESGRTTRVIVKIGEDIRLASTEGGAPTVTWTLDGLHLHDESTGLKRNYKSTYRPWPLHVGKAWKANVEWVNSRGAKGYTTQEAVVVAIEDVETPAGKFSVYKIEMTGFWNNYSSNRNGRQVEVFWYSPALGIDLRRTFDDGFRAMTTELVWTNRK